MHGERMMRTYSCWWYPMIVGTCRWVTKDDLSLPRIQRNKIICMYIYIYPTKKEKRILSLCYTILVVGCCLFTFFGVPIMCRKNSVKLKLLARSNAQNGRCFLLNLPGQPYNIVIGALPFVMVCTHGHKPFIPLPLLALGTNTNIYIYILICVYIYIYIYYPLVI